MKKLLAVFILVLISLGAISSSYAAQTTPATTHTKKSSTPGKRYRQTKNKTAAAHLKKGGTTDKRYKQNKTSANPASTGSAPTSNDMKTSMPKPKANQK